MRVALVEDDYDQRLLVAEHLRQNGFTVTLVEPEQALTASYYEGCDAAIVDWFLGPTVSGSEVLGFLQSSLPMIRRVVSSATEAPEMLLLADRVLQKPHGVADLVAALRG